MMKPIYPSPLLDLSGWYAYRRPEGKHLVWDGGLRREFYDEDLKVHPLPDSFKNQLPNTPLEGYYHENYFSVVGVPQPDELLKIIVPDHKTEVKTFDVLQNGQVGFLLECLLLREKIEGNEFYAPVPFYVLPEHKEEARKCFGDLGPGAVARHPRSKWVVGYNTAVVQDRGGYMRYPGEFYGGHLYIDNISWGPFVVYEVPEGPVTLVYEGTSLVGVE